jgi:hypothetical protein
MRRQLTAWCIVALGLLGLGACAQPAGSVNAGAGSPSGAPVAAPSSAPAPSPSGLRFPPPIASKPPILKSPVAPLPSSGAQMSITGTIYAGAEPTCLLLRQGSGEYLLLANSSTKLRAGEHAVVTGHVIHGVMTHCQQGQPFVVTNVDPLSPN